MAITRDDKTGTYTVTYHYIDAITKEHRTKKRRGIKLRREAKRIEGELFDSVNQKPTTATFATISEMYLGSLDDKSEVKEQKRRIYRKYFKEYLDRPLASISKADLMRYRSYISDQDLSYRHKNKCLSYVKAVFKYANEIYDIPNVSTVMKPFKASKKEMVNEKKRKEMQTWTPEEMQKVLDATDNPVYRLFFEFLYWSGCRRGEALALHKEDLTPDHYVNIDKATRDQNDEDGDVKTFSSIRKIKLDSKTYADLQPLMSIPGPYLFGGETSLAPTTVQHKFDEAITKAGVKRIRLHDLRHSHATFLINNGANIVAVSKRLGHKNVTTTLNTYTHLFAGTNDEMMEMIENERTSENDHTHDSKETK